MNTSLFGGAGTSMSQLSTSARDFSLVGYRGRLDFNATLAHVAHHVINRVGQAEDIWSQMFSDKLGLQSVCGIVGRGGTPLLSSG